MAKESDRRKANQIRREMDPVVAKLRNFDKHMEAERRRLQEKYDKYLSELEKVT